MKTRLAMLADAIGGRLHGKDTVIAGVSTDTRTLRPGELFVALKGPNFDGCAFVGQAAEKGAAAAVVDRVVDVDLPQLEVADTRLALGEMGKWWRRRMPATVVGITGSNGKTTLKELVAAILSRSAPTLATEGNLNNDIGMPLMLTRIEPEHRYAVIEMGANHVGEIAYLTSLAEPAVVTITNAGTAHLEGFGSLERIARGKGEILEGERRPDAAVLNADDKYYAHWRSRARDARVLSFGLSERADVWGGNIETSREGTSFRLHLPDETVAVTLPLSGAHNVRNACTAAAIALALDIPAALVVAGLEAAAPVAGRLEPLEGLNGATLFDDSYNANPGSVVAAGEFLGSLAGRNWLVLGDMYELGREAESMHADVGADLRKSGIDRLFTLGQLSRFSARAFGNDAESFDSVGALVERVAAELAPDVNVLVKGSRGMRMERVVDGLRAETVRRCAEG